jgi:hypothetical protein
MNNEQRKGLNSLLWGVIGTAVIVLVMGFYELLTLFMNERMAWMIVIGGAVVILATFIGVKAKEFKKFISAGRILTSIYLFFSVFIITWVLYSLAQDLAQDFNKDKNDKYEYKDGKVYFTEAKYIFGSPLHKDTLVLSDDNIEIFSRSFFGEKKTVRPYSNLKEVIFSKAFVGYKIVIVYPSSFLGNSETTFYFNKNDTFDLLNPLFKDYSKNRCVITESL